MSARKPAEEALVDLIMCTRTRKRNVSLVRASEILDEAISAYGNLEKVADRIGISSKMLSQFLAIQRLTPAVRQYFESRRLDSVDMASQLTLLNARDQLLVAEKAAEGKLDSSDVRAIVQLRKKELKDKIEKVVERVIQSRTTKEYVVEFVCRGGLTLSVIEKVFVREFGKENIVRVEVDGLIGKLVLGKAGKMKLLEIAKRRGSKTASVIGALLSDRRKM